MKTVKEIQAEVKREESVLNQLEKRGAASSVIEAQKEAVKAAKKKLEAALNTPTEKAIQSTATTGFVTFNVVKDGETIKESKKIAFVKHNRPIDTKRVDKYGAQNETYIEGWEKKTSNLLIYKRLCNV